LPDALTLILAFAGAAGLVQLTVPLAIRLALRTGFLDHPVGYKRHGRPTPYLGGLGVMVAVLPAALVFGWDSDVLVIVACAAGLCAVGIVDDRAHLGAGVRVLAEFTAAFALWRADLGWLLWNGNLMDLALTTIWVVGLVNAFNLMDNLDGATGTVGAVSAAGVGLVAGTQGELAIAAMCFALAGACTSFLRFNLARPARVFLGDGGSMPIGFLVAAGLTAIPSTPGFGTAAVFAVVPIVGLAALDTSLVVFSRIRRGVWILTGGRDHLTHRLLDLVGTPQKVALVLAGVQASLCALGFLLFDSTIVTVFTAATAYVILGAAAIAALEWPYVRAEARAAAEATLSPALASARQESAS
jgi:UDP-GlcNAc:undecaprenyl-phosphate/decaprenyl-phosphate GlcNAc-1-phosphate transferase